MVDAIDSGDRATGVQGVGQAEGPQGAQENAGSQVGAAADAVGPAGVQQQARLTAGRDGYDGVQGDGKKDPGQESAAETGQEQKLAQGLKDGQWLHDPRQITPQQAKELKDMLSRPDLSPDTKREIKEFLNDYHNRRDRLFPEFPNPLPRPYPWPKSPTQVG